MRDSNSPTSAAEVIDLLRDKHLLDEVGLSAAHARQMRWRNRIPGHRHSAIVSVAKRHGLPITLELLSELASASAKRRVPDEAAVDEQSAA